MYEYKILELLSIRKQDKDEKDSGYDQGCTTMKCDSKTKYPRATSFPLRKDKQDTDLALGERTIVAKSSVWSFREEDLHTKE